MAQPFVRNRTLKLERGLYLLEQRGGKTYAARAWLDGAWQYENLQTADYHTAERHALIWFRRVKRRQEKTGETMAAAVGTYLNSIHDPGKRANHLQHWNAIREFFAPGFGKEDVYVADVDSPLLVAFVEWKRQRVANVTVSTIRKDLVTIRQALRYAVLRGVISALPTFPGAHVVGTVKANPQPWLTRDEWAHLLKVARRRVQEASNVRTRRQREELRRFIEFMVATCLRVDEARHLRVRDCTIKSRWVSAAKARGPRGAKSTIQVARRYLEINVRMSKTGPRTCISRPTATLPYEELAAGKKPSDALFAETHRDAFRELLIAADLRVNAFGLARNAKCLRPTAISHWLLDQPTIPLSWLAANCGTSITMLQQFYVRRLGLRLNGLDWL